MVIFHSFEGYQTVFSPLEELVKSGRLHDTRSRLPGDPNVELKMVFVTYTYTYISPTFKDEKISLQPICMMKIVVFHLEEKHENQRNLSVVGASRGGSVPVTRRCIATAVTALESGWALELPWSLTNTHMLHVWNVYLHLGHFWGKCYSIHHELVCEQAVLRLVLSSNLDTASNGWSQDWFDIDIATGVEHRTTPRFRAFGSFGSEFLCHFPAVLEMTTWDDLAFENWFQSSTPLVNESYHGMSLAFSGQGQSKRPSWHFRQKVRLCPRHAGASGFPGFHPVLISSPNSARLLRAVFHLL